MSDAAGVGSVDGDVAWLEGGRGLAGDSVGEEAWEPWTPYRPGEVASGLPPGFNDEV